MFEKEAEEYANGKGHEHYNYLFEEHAGSPSTFANWCYKDGAEFGYNKAKKQSEYIIKRLLANRPDTYSGTDVVTNQTKMFAFDSAVKDAIEYLEESE